MEGQLLQTQFQPSIWDIYNLTETPKPRRKLVRRPLLTPKENIPANEENLDDKLIATPVFNSEIVNDNNYVVFGQCDAICCIKHPNLCNNVTLKVDTSTQTEDFVTLDHPYVYEMSTKNVGTQHSTAEFSFQDITSDSDARFYAGLNLTILTALVTMLSTYGKNLPYKLPASDQILSVLMRLRLGLKFHDIGRRFNVSRTLASAMYRSWIDIMSLKLSDCVVWLPRETIRRTMPSSFRDLYPKTTCIIDCFEVYIQRPFSLKARNQTYSTYKSHNTAKVLVAIAPNGFIMFTSKSYGGRASDNYITKSSGFLEYLLPGDEVMADRGFTIAEDLCARRVKLNIPSFLEGRKQLSEEETIESRRIASVRIHVERTINRMKSYRILSTTVNIKSLKQFDKEVRVVSYLCNMQDSLIKETEQDN